MKSINTYYTTKEELVSFINDEKIQNSSSLLIQIFSAIIDKTFISTLLSELTQLLPNSVIIGSTTDGEIMDGKVTSGKVVLSFTQFEHTTLKSAAIEHKVDGYYSGQYLAKELIGEDTKLLIAFADGLHTNGDNFLKGISSVNNNVIVAGGHAGDGFEFKKTIVFTKDHIFEQGAVGVTLNSKQLHVNTDYSFDWHPIGNELTVTRAEGNRIYTIDGKKAVDIYAHYLGDEIAKGLPSIGIEFPLIVNRNGFDVARSIKMKMNDGSLIVAGDLNTNEKVRIGFGGRKEIIKASHTIANHISKKPSEVIFVYSCTARKHFMGSEIESEILPLVNISPISGFFTYGEFFTSNKNELLNQTMTLLSLSENDTIKEVSFPEKPQQTDVNSASIEALTHLINVSSQEVKEQTEILKESNKLNQQLRERMELALQGSKTSILDWDFTNNNFYISSSWKEMLGFTDKELPNSLSTWKDRVHKDDMKIVLSSLKKSKNKKIKFFENSQRLKHKDGHWVWIFGRAQILYDENGQAVRMIGAQTDITEEKNLQIKLLEQKEILFYQAHHDALTGLPNRVLFFDRLEQGIRKAKRHSEGLALLFIDLDKFKHINDSLGHDVGDSVLKIVSKRLEGIVRKEDTVARLSGDEFTIIIEELKNPQHASILAEKILETLKEPIHIDDHKLFVSGSIGISMYPEDATCKLDLLKYADTAMYKAKEEGRNNFQFYSPEMTEFAMKRIIMKTYLRQALDNAELRIHYQPQINSCTGELVGLEALVRWQHPTMGLLAPDKFIPLAEDTGMIVEVDKWVMSTSMKQVSDWYKEGLKPGLLALNLSIKQLESNNFIQIIKESIKACDFKAEWLEVEITEGQMMTKPKEVISKLEEINDLGVSISIDDFGTGYSSLSLLKRLPIHRLKIDQSFIQDIPENEEDVAIVSAIIALGNSLKLDLIAEGVETSAQKDFLIDNGCINMQGYYFSHPVSAEEIKHILLDKPKLS